ncbi:MAG: hypothetical protein EOM59_12875 [Clostridia bacterium]|nr:hypothetical protein [Clostridia bacterium]
MGMIIKSSMHSGVKFLSDHLQRTDTNEKYSITSQGLIGESVFQSMSELSAISTFSAKHGTKRTLLHVSISPDQPLTDDEWDRAWDTYEQEFGITGSVWIEATHTKYRQNGDLQQHKHRVYSSVCLETGKVINRDNVYQRQEYLGRKLETELGHELVQGAHNVFAYQYALNHGDTVTADAIKDSGLMDGERAIAKRKRKEAQQEDRTGIKKSDVLNILATAYNGSTSTHGFLYELNLNGLWLMQGDKAVVLVDSEGGTHPVKRYLNQAKKQGQLTTVDKFDFDSLTLEKLPPRKSKQRKNTQIERNLNSLAIANEGNPLYAWMDTTAGESSFIDSELLEVGAINKTEISR